MGSRIMHAIIANKIAENMSMDDRTVFLFGSVAPDAFTPKELSHFFKGEVRDYSRYIDYKGFFNKYSSHAESDYKKTEWKPIMNYIIYTITIFDCLMENYWNTMDLQLN